MTTAPGVAVIATQIARTDRRALSEAWYSALHLVHGAAAPATSSHRASVSAPLHARAAHALRPSAGREPVRATLRERARYDRAAVRAPLVERRRVACETSRRIERAVTTLALRPNGDTAHTVDVAGGRVRLLVRASHGVTRIIAVCAAPLREPVERALASARFALAGSGISTVTP
jgi:hypothetical protein